eukprot:scaffold699_cov231-Pinguiococcus_pyrenoidosus.AAC.4
MRGELGLGTKSSSAASSASCASRTSALTSKPRSVIVKRGAPSEAEPRSEARRLVPRVLQMSCAPAGRH